MRTLKYKFFGLLNNMIIIMNVYQPQMRQRIIVQCQMTVRETRHYWILHDVPLVPKLMQSFLSRDPAIKQVPGQIK